MYLNKTCPSTAKRNQKAGATDLENRIIEFERYSFGKFQNAIRSIQPIHHSSGFDRFIHKIIIPALAKIGFDVLMAKSFFQMAPTWKQMGAYDGNCIYFHPVFIRDLQEVKKAVISKTKKRGNERLLLSGISPNNLHALVKTYAHPANILFLLDEITISWIILPRAYNHLGICHSRCLTGYLALIENEENPAFRKLLIRIVVEFIANFTFKYHDRQIDTLNIRDALFYGYVSQFYKNLRSPPEGYENENIFENFFRWAVMFQKRFAPQNEEMKDSVEKMVSIKEKIFPTTNAFGLTRKVPVHMVDNFSVALRHGQTGVETVLKYFGLGGIILKNVTDGRLPYKSVPAVLNIFLRVIRKNYHLETQKTRYFIMWFLKRLHNSYDFKQNGLISTEKEMLERLRFIGPRVMRLIDEFARSV